MILAITGHRPHKLGGYYTPNPCSDAVMLKLHDSLKTLQPEVVLTGMALGVDQWTAQLCVEMQIPFDAVIAFEGYEAKWPDKAQKRYRNMLTLARKVEMLSPGPYRPSLLHHRNHWLVDHSDALLAVWDGRPGSGTAACVDYAVSKKDPKPAYRLDLPETFWSMARGEEEILQERRAVAIQKHIENLKPPPIPFKLPEPSNTLAFRRFIDVGDDEP